jgi:NAD(P)-dependent dehydrogenase (short-subunit alcohol dehydrogenase family)
VRTILITGATDGLGRATARELAMRGNAVLLHGRSEAKARDAVEEIKRASGNDGLRYFLADLSSLQEVRRLAAEVQGDQERLDVLVNNAGIALSDRERRLSEDGYELTFAVNYLSHFLLTNLLLEALRRSAPVRIVNVSSVGQHPIDFDDVMLERGYEPFRAYAQSKLAQILFTFELAERLQGEDVTVNALHPATLMDTKMVRETFGRPMSSLEEGTEALLHLVEAAELDGTSGRYFDGLRESTANPQAYDPEARRRLWELSERLCEPQVAEGTGPAP